MISRKKRMRILFISEYSLQQNSSGCLHYKDILQSVGINNETNHLHISNQIRCSNLFEDIKKTDYCALGSLNPPIILHEHFQEIKSYRLNVASYYDDKEIYSNETDRYLALVINKYRFFLLAKHIKDSFINYYDLFVVFLQEPTAFFLAEGLICQDQKVISLIMDPPEMRHGIYLNNHLSRDFINTSFKSCIRDSLGLIMPSEEAKNISRIDNINREIAVAYPVIRGTFYSDLQDDQAKFNNCSRTINIVLVGQIYALESLAAFLKGLVILKSKINLDAVNFVYYGGLDGKNKLGKLKAESKYSAINIMINEPLNHSRLIEEIKGKYDFGYVPFPFSEDMSDTVSYSFPSKFVSYVEAGIMPMYHGPQSTVYNFLKKYNLTELSISSTNSNSIANNMSSIINEYNFKNKNEIISKLSDIFGKKKLASNMNNFINKIMSKL